jgi:hypothetical protein
MSDSERPSVETLIESWTFKFGEERHTKANVPYIFIDFAIYREALNSLLNTIAEAGYSESEIREKLLIRKIQDAMTPEVHDTHKLKDWRDIIEKIWKYYIAKKYANLDLVKDATNYPKNTQKPKLVTSTDTEAEYIAPVSKLDPNKFQGFGPAQIVNDEEWVKLLEEMKKDE